MEGEEMGNGKKNFDPLSQYARDEDRERFVNRLVSLVEQDVAKSVGNARYSHEEFSNLVGFALENLADALFKMFKKDIRTYDPQ